MIRLANLLSLVILLLCSRSSLCSGFENLTCDCTLEPTLETRKAFNETIDDNIKFLYLKLNFNTTFNNTEFAYLRDTLNVIDPLTWVLAVGGNGELLLQSPFDFRYVSLGALSASGVKSLTLNITTPECFTSDIPDEEKICAIVKMVDRLTQDAVGFFHERKGEVIFQLDTFKVCLEKQSDEKRYVYRDRDRTETLLRRLTESAHGVLQSTVEYTCWVADDIGSDPDVIPSVRAYWWVNWLINTIVTLLVLFSPYPFFSYFDWHNPPKDGKIRIDTQPYPFGFFHFVFYSTFARSGCTYNLCSLSCWLRYIFLCIFLVFLCCIQFVPYVYVDHDTYKLRKMAAERLGVWQFDWSNRLLAFFCIGVVLFNIVLFNILKFSISRRHLDTDKKDNEDRGHSLKRIGKSYLTTELIFTEVDDKDIVAILCPETSGDLFVHSPNVQDIWSIWQVLRNLKKGKRSRWVKILLLPIILAYWVGQAIPLIYYTNVVLVVILSLVHRSFSKKKDGRRVLLQVGSAPGVEEQERGSLNQVVGEESKQTVADVLLLYLALLPFCFVFVFVTAPVFFQMFIACSYLIDVVGYTLVGVIVNAKYVVAWIVFVLGVVSFLVQTITGYSNTYVTLFYEIFNIAESVGSKAVSRDADGVPQIKLDFFFRFAYKMKPWKPVLFFIYLHLASAGVFFFLGYLLLRYVGGLNDLKGQSELLGAVVIGGLLPIAKLLAVSPATANCKGKAKKCKLEQMIKDYEATEQGEIQVPEAEAEEFHSFGNQRNGDEGQIQQVSVGDHV